MRGTPPTGSRAARRGELLDLFGTVVDADGRPIDRAEVEIWQCDVFGSYRHPRGAGDRVDDGFQGFGSTRSDARAATASARSGRCRTRAHAAHPRQAAASGFGECTSQLFVAGEPGNARDVLYASLGEPSARRRDAAAARAAGDAGRTWLADARLTSAPAALSCGRRRRRRRRAQPLAVPVDVVAAQAVEVGAVEHARQHEQQVATAGSGTGAARR